jgi:hypothetical protein
VTLDSTITGLKKIRRAVRRETSAQKQSETKKARRFAGLPDEFHFLSVHFANLAI